MRHLGLIAAFLLSIGIPALAQPAGPALVALEALPDAPGATPAGPGEVDASSSAWSSSQPAAWDPLTLDAAYGSSGSEGAPGSSCTLSDVSSATDTEAELPAPLAAPRSSCLMLQNPLRPFATPPVTRLSPRGKLHLAVYDLTNPGNLAAVAANAVYTVATDAHGPYGPGFNGFRRNVQVSLAGEASFEMIGTFGVCTVVHQDPRYMRLPHASPVRRLVHAIAHVAIAQSDSGRAMPNLENLVTSYATAELANLYVPGIDSSAASTNRRILTGFATDPIGNILAEFLPDLASHVHVRIVLMQRLLNQMSSGQQGS
jgi:hypothetical protein